MNYTLTYFAEHAATFSHDAVKRYLPGEKITPRLVWEQGCGDIVFSPGGALLFDDTVRDKDYSAKIERVRWQYSGHAHGVIKGMGAVTGV